MGNDDIRTAIRKLSSSSQQRIAQLMRIDVNLSSDLAETIETTLANLSPAKRSAVEIRIQRLAEE